MKRKIAVLYGGRSGDMRCRCARPNRSSTRIDPERYDVVRYFISKDGKWDPRPISPSPMATRYRRGLPGAAWHVRRGWDDQGLFELAGLPYVGPGVLASSAAMDKEVTKRLCVQAGLPVVDYAVVRGGAYDASEFEARFGYPMFVKPANLDHLGISKAKNRQELEAAITDAARYDTKVIVKRAILGQEVECAVLGNDQPQASTPCEILPFKDSTITKISTCCDKTEFRIPPDLPAGCVQEFGNWRSPVRVRSAARACTVSTF